VAFRFRLVRLLPAAGRHGRSAPGGGGDRARRRIRHRRCGTVHPRVLGLAPRALRHRQRVAAFSRALFGGTAGPAQRDVLADDHGPGRRRRRPRGPVRSICRDIRLFRCAGPGRAVLRAVRPGDRRR
jgi:hypothetical protein